MRQSARRLRSTQSHFRDNNHLTKKTQTGFESKVVTYCLLILFFMLSVTMGVMLSLWSKRVGSRSSATIGLEVPSQLDLLPSTAQKPRGITTDPNSWGVYSSEMIGIRFQYPPELMIKEVDGGLEIFFDQWGLSNQAQKTDFIFINRVEIERDRVELEELVDQEIAQITQESNLSKTVIEPKSMVRVGRSIGYRYSVQSDGQESYYYIQDPNTQKVLRLQVSLSASQLSVYQQVVSTMFSSFEFIKPSIEALPLNKR